MKLKRFENSGSIMPLSSGIRTSFRQDGVVHLQNCFSEGLVSKLKSELSVFIKAAVDNYNSGYQFRDISFAKFLKSLRSFELESCLSQFGTDLLNSDHVFLYDGPVAGKEACSIWIPIEDTDAGHLGLLKIGDCVIFHATTPYDDFTPSHFDSFPKGILIHLVGDAVALNHTDSGVVA